MKEFDLVPLSLRYRKILAAMGSLPIHAQGPRKVEMIAVSKRQPTDLIHQLYQLGHRHFGENYVQELIYKAEELKARGCAEISWHLIGRLQTNKVKLVLPYVDCIHSVDSVRLAQRLSQLRLGNPLSVFLQVNIDDQASKAGFTSEELLRSGPILSNLKGLGFLGLMCVPDSSKDPRSAFARLRALEIRLRPLTEGKLSMGMSDDFEIAIQEGATHIRVGSGLFGTRAETPF